MTSKVGILLLFALFVFSSCEVRELVVPVSAGDGANAVLSELPEAELASVELLPNEMIADETPLPDGFAPGLFSGVSNSTGAGLDSSLEKPDYAAIQPNEAGEIPIIMYHGIDAADPGRYDRLTSDFSNDLQALYDGGFRLVSLNDALRGNIDVPAGYSPAVLTFDDAKKSAFSLQETDGKLVPTAGCAVDILERFNEDHPGFGTAAAFFVIGCDEPFRGAGTVAERLTYLTENGYEIGNHTYSHSNLGKMNAGQLQYEFGFTGELLRSVLPELELNAIAYPGGVSPAEDLTGYVTNGEYNGAEYNYSWGLRCAPGRTSSNPFNKNFDPVNVPRLRPTDDSTMDYPVLDLWYFLRKYREEPWLKFISDGLPETVAVHSGWKDRVNENALGGRELVVWD